MFRFSEKSLDFKKRPCYQKNHKFKKCLELKEIFTYSKNWSEFHKMFVFSNCVLVFKKMFAFEKNPEISKFVQVFKKYIHIS